MVPGLERATELVLELCGGVAAAASPTSSATRDMSQGRIDFPLSPK
jgi:hypothetical protein